MKLFFTFASLSMLIPVQVAAAIGSWKLALGALAVQGLLAIPVFIDKK